MKDRITCFKLNWYDCGLSCAEDRVQEELTIYRNDNYMVIKELNGYGVICSCTIIHIEKEKVDAFFSFLEKISNKWENDYKSMQEDMIYGQSLSFRELIDKVIKLNHDINQM